LRPDRRRQLDSASVKSIYSSADDQVDGVTLTESTHRLGTSAVNVSAENAYSTLDLVQKLVKSETFLIDLEFNICYIVAAMTDKKTLCVLRRGARLKFYSHDESNIAELVDE